MKLKKQKQLRRHMRFYRVQCGFREPFKVLIDGSFLHVALQLKLGVLADELPKVVGGPVKPYVTRCIAHELRSKGAEFSGSALAARRLDTMRCEHTEPVPACDCIRSLIGDDNSRDHFVVATQNQAFRAELMRTPAVPLLWANANAINLEPPSQYQRDVTTNKEQAQRHVSAREQKKLTSLSSPSDPSTSSSTTFKRKRPQGPNPLSMKKRKAAQEAPNPQPQEAIETNDKPKRQRKRQRGKKKEDATSD